MPSATPSAVVFATNAEIRHKILLRPKFLLGTRCPDAATFSTSAHLQRFQCNLYQNEKPKSSVQLLDTFQSNRMKVLISHTEHNIKRAGSELCQAQAQVCWPSEAQHMLYCYLGNLPCRLYSIVSKIYNFELH